MINDLLQMLAVGCSIIFGILLLELVNKKFAEDNKVVKWKLKE